jgi:hypothetical protein
LAIRFRTRLVVGAFETLGWRDGVNLSAFVVVVGLIGLITAIQFAPMFAALYVFIAVDATLFVVNLIPLLGPGRWSLRAFITPVRRFLDEAPLDAA